MKYQIVKPRLPMEYQEVEWIKSDSNQHIDLNVYGNLNTKVRIDFRYTEVQTSSRLFGARADSNQQAFCLGEATNGNYFGHFDSIFATDVYQFLKDTQRHIFEFSGNGLFIDGIQSTEYTTTPSAFTTPQPLRMFNFYSSNTGVGSIGRLYNLMIWDASTLVRNFIPCFRKSDGVIGLYDLCGSICPLTSTPFYVNSGTGAFTKGANKTELVKCDIATYDAQNNVIERCNIWHDLPREYQRVEYIQSTGTQYIDSNYKGNLNTEVEIKVKQLDDTTGSTITPFGNNVIADNVITINLSTINSPRNSRFGDKVIAKGGVSLNQDLVIKTNKSGLWINGIKQRDFGATSNFQTDNLWVCQCRNLAPSTYNDCDLRLYYCKILENNALVRNFIPCYHKASGVIGLYDTINDKFYINQGTGTFGKGADVN